MTRERPASSKHLSDPSAAPAWPYGLALAALVFLGVGFGLLAAEARRAEPRGPDQVALHWVEQHRGSYPGVTRVFEIVTRLGGWPWSVVLTGAVALAIAVITRGEPRSWKPRELLFFAGVVASSWGLGRVVKLIIQRERPPLALAYLGEPGFSFPSGHSLFGAVCLGMLAVVVWRLSGLNVGYRAAVSLLCLGLIGALAGSRVWLGVHYPSDVVGGVALGLVWVVLAWTVREAWGDRSRRPIA